MSELIPLDRAQELPLRFATALVQDGVTGVRVVTPRAPGVLTHARVAARAAGVEVCAEHIGSATITLSFSGRQLPLPRPSPSRRWAWAWLRPLLGSA